MNVLFVDDEPNMLSGLKRTLRPMRDSWRSYFAEGVEQALQILQEHECDVVVSDMSMPGRSGVDLLAEVAARHPQTIRIALSGNYDINMACESALVTHQYLSKPCGLQDLKESIEKAGRLKSMLDDRDLAGLVAGLTTVPVLPEIYKELLDELRSENSSIERVGAIVERDISMTAKLLKLVNSSYFGLRRNISSPAEAANYLGLDVIGTLVLTLKVFAEFEQDQHGRLLVAELWDHSNHTAASARFLAETLGPDDKLLADQAYTAGMLHDIGVVILGANRRRDYETALTIAENESIPSWQAERRVFGKTHMDVGAYLLGLWGFPEPIVQAAGFHHVPAAAGPGHEISPLTLVHLADAISDQVFGASEARETRTLEFSYLRNVGLAESIDELKMRLQQRFDNVAA